MKKDKAKALIDSGKALELLRQILQPGAESHYIIKLGRFQAAGEIKEDDEGWTPIAIHRTAGMEMQYDDTFASQGGARIITEHRACDAGYAFQGAHGTGLAGIWLWGAD